MAAEFRDRGGCARHLARLRGRRHTSAPGTASLSWDRAPGTVALEVSARLAFESDFDATVWVHEHRNGVLTAHLDDAALQCIVIIYRDLFEVSPTLDEDTPHLDARGSIAERIHHEPAFG